MKPCCESCTTWEIVEGHPLNEPGSTKNITVGHCRNKKSKCFTTGGEYKCREYNPCDPRQAWIQREYRINDDGRNYWETISHYANCPDCDRLDGMTCKAKKVRMQPYYYVNERVIDKTCHYSQRTYPSEGFIGTIFRLFANRPDIVIKPGPPGEDRHDVLLFRCQRCKKNFVALCFHENVVRLDFNESSNVDPRVEQTCKQCTPDKTREKNRTLKTIPRSDKNRNFKITLDSYVE